MSSKRGGLALISLVTAIDGVLLVGLGVGLARTGATSPVIGLALAVFGTVPALLAVVLALVAIRRHGPSAPARVGLAIGLIQTAVTVVMGFSALGAPNINDITTDLVDPPALLLQGGEFVPYPPAFAEEQRAAYPDVRPLSVARPVDEVMSLAREVAVATGWDIIGDAAGGDGFRATATTGVFRFMDDIVVRVTPDGQGARIDVRSRSRVGRSDLGANAARIQDYLESVRRRVEG